MGNETMTEEEIAFAEIVGDLVEQWGFKRHLGRIWSLCYLRPDPVKPLDIQEALELSAGSVSTALAELQTWGVVRRIRVAGDRNFYFTAETHIWKSVSNVLRTRELRILKEASGGMEALGARLQSKSKGERSEFQQRRVKHVREALDTAHGLFSHLIDGGLLSLAKMNKLYERLRNH